MRNFASLIRAKVYPQMFAANQWHVINHSLLAYSLAERLKELENPAQFMIDLLKDKIDKRDNVRHIICIQ